jgi:glutamate-ammonia-ligase adenylyltransferase
VAINRKKIETLDPWVDVPEALQNPVRQSWNEYLEAAGRRGCRYPQDPGLERSLARLFACSKFAAATCRQMPDIVHDLLESGDLLADYRPAWFIGSLRRQFAGQRDEAALKRALRRVRTREMVRIAWRDLAGWSRLEDTLADLTALAEGCIRGALEMLAQTQRREQPAPVDTHGREVSLVVLGMGKLGAGELNFSSDIDLIFAYPDAVAAKKRGAPEPEEYFTRLGRALINVLNDNDENGFVFRVDMRLRPYGNSGALVCSFEAMEDYYQSQGREWERYAMIKARPVGGEEADGAALMALLRPFVYRRYLDYNAFAALRDLKRQIQAQVERKGQQDNLKLGPGGIREVEFIAQALQLVRGGREQRMQNPNLLQVYDLIVEDGHLPAETVDDLTGAYRFLRFAENRLQAIRDQQVHSLPAHDLDRARLAFAMGFDGWDAFLAALDVHRARVQEHFGQLFAGPAEEGSEQPARRIWLEELDKPQAIRLLDEMGYDDSAEVLRWIGQLRSGVAQQYLGEQGRLRFDQLVPQLIVAAAGEGGADTFTRLARVMERIAGRTTYLSLLLEHPAALQHLVRLCAASAWIAEQLARQPILLDQLLDARTLFSALDTVILRTELIRAFEAVPADDLERQMDVLRQFRHAMVLRVAAADIVGAIPLMVVSDYLTAIAEVVLEKTLELVWTYMVERHGEPRCTDGDTTRTARFIVVGYGKLGGIELGYGSDLDLVFLHDSGGAVQRTDGKKPIENSLFFSRLGQRMIHMLETLTGAGVLYEVDMRLRPSGNSGLLVSSLEAFRDYQEQEAWTWEHQALVRARPICGDAGLARRFEDVRQAVLRKRRDAAELKTDVREMRERMRTELGSGRRAGFHLKQDPGGIVDIEFMVQYLVLRWSCDHPALVRYTDTIRIIAALEEAGLLAAADAACLADVYRSYRALNHRRTLAGESSLIGGGLPDSEPRAVLALWKRIMEKGDA